MLRRPSGLSKKEIEQIKKHPEYSLEFLKQNNINDPLIETIIIQHHERYDGKGYPKGYSQEKICLGARIMAVADSFDAMTTSRPYAKKFTPQEAIEEIKRCSGTQYDPKIVDAFVKLTQQNTNLLIK